MKNLVLTALVVVLSTAGCRSRNSSDKQQAKLQSATAPDVGVVEKLFSVLDERERTRVGFIERNDYKSGRVVYWVYGPHYKLKLGYLLPNNRAYRFRWQAGQRIAGEDEFPADTMNSNVRRVLDYGAPVVIEAIGQKELAGELLKGRYAEPKAEAGTDGTDGCGDE